MIYIKISDQEKANLLFGNAFYLKSNSDKKNPADRMHVVILINIQETFKGKRISDLFFLTGTGSNELIQDVMKASQTY